MSDAAVRRLERLSGEETTPKLRGWPLLVAFAAAGPAGAALLVRASQHGRTVPAAIYVAALVALYGVGWVYHLLRWAISLSISTSWALASLYPAAAA